jgi:tetratricopeptide (TPR) repeat protein
MYAGDLDGAIEAWRKTFEIAPDFGVSHGYLADLYAVQRKYAEAEAEYDKGSPRDRVERGRGIMYALAGRRADALRVVEQMTERAKRAYVSPAARGLIWVALGEKDRGYALLGQACAQSDWMLLEVKMDPLLESLRAEPRFHDLLKCIHLE